MIAEFLVGAAAGSAATWLVMKASPAAEHHGQAIVLAAALRSLLPPEAIWLKSDDSRAWLEVRRDAVYRAQDVLRDAARFEP